MTRVEGAQRSHRGMQWLVAALGAVLAALAWPQSAAPSATLNLSGTWFGNYHCEVGWCVGKDFPAKDTITQAQGSSFVKLTNGSEVYEGTLTGNILVLQGGTGSYRVEVTVTIAPDGNSWTGKAKDNNGTSGTNTGKREGGASSSSPERLAVSAGAAPVSGTVLVRVPGASGFTSPTALSTIPFGSVIEATHGRVRVTTAAPHGGTQTGEFFEGQFILGQAHSGLVSATLSGGDYSVCPTSRERAHRARVSAHATRVRHVVRKLWASAHGSFSTRGNYAAGAVQGTEWLTEDLCEGTLIHVTRDRVLVTNLVNHHRILVHTGHSYLARLP